MKKDSYAHKFSYIDPMINKCPNQNIRNRKMIIHKGGKNSKHPYHPNPSVNYLINTTLKRSDFNNIYLFITPFFKT